MYHYAYYLGYLLRFVAITSFVADFVFVDERSPRWLKKFGELWWAILIGTLVYNIFVMPACRLHF